MDTAAVVTAQAVKAVEAVAVEKVVDPVREADSLKPVKSIALCSRRTSFVESLFSQKSKLSKQKPLMSLGVQKFVRCNFLI